MDLVLEIVNELKTWIRAESKQLIHGAIEEYSSNPKTNPNKLIDFDEAAKIVGIDKRSVPRRLKRLNIPTTRKGRKGAIESKYLPKFIQNK